MISMGYKKGQGITSPGNRRACEGLHATLHKEHLTLSELEIETDHSASLWH
jgi:hypothetical protein